MFDCWRVDKGDTWRGVFGISAENWVNLYSEVLHLKIGRAPKSGKFRSFSICYSAAFRNRAICKTLESEGSPSNSPQKITKSHQNPHQFVLAIKHLLSWSQKSKDQQQKSSPSSWTPGFILDHPGDRFLGWSSRTSIWSRKSCSCSGGQGVTAAVFSVDFCGKNEHLGLNVRICCWETTILATFWAEIFGAWERNGEGYSFSKRVEGGLKGKNIIWKWSWRYESQTGLGAM